MNVLLTSRARSTVPIVSLRPEFRPEQRSMPPRSRLLLIRWERTDSKLQPINRWPVDARRMSHGGTGTITAFSSSVLSVRHGCILRFVPKATRCVVRIVTVPCVCRHRKKPKSSGRSPAGKKRENCLRWKRCRYHKFTSRAGHPHTLPPRGPRFAVRKNRKLRRGRSSHKSGRFPGRRVF